MPVAWLSWIYTKNRYLGFWSKYNFVLSASFSSGIAIGRGSTSAGAFGLAAGDGASATGGVLKDQRVGITAA